MGRVSIWGWTLHIGMARCFEKISLGFGSGLYELEFTLNGMEWG